MHEEIILHFWLTPHRRVPGASPPMKLHLWLIINAQGQTVEISAVSLYICNNFNFCDINLYLSHFPHCQLNALWLEHVKIIQHNTPNDDGSLAYMIYPSGIITVCKVK